MIHEGKRNYKSERSLAMDQNCGNNVYADVCMGKKRLVTMNILGLSDFNGKK